MLSKIIEPDYLPAALFVAMVCGVVLIVAVAATLTSTRSPSVCVRGEEMRFTAQTKGTGGRAKGAA